MKKQKDAFVEQILAHPDDRSIRLVYADWLVEQDDPRAEFIRIQEEMASVPVYSDRYAELKPRRKELREKIDSDWQEKMGYVPAHLPMFTNLPESRPERWRLVEEFIELWYRPLQAGDGASEAELVDAEKQLGFRLPAALREWYALAGKREDVWSIQDTLLDPLALQVRQDQGALIFLIENQCCEVWGVRAKDLGLEDPPVHRFYEPARVSPALSTFAIQMLLYVVKFSGNIRALGGSGETMRACNCLAGLFTACTLFSTILVAEKRLVFAEVESIGLPECDSHNRSC
jgi:uncharacterized protein (TIGR02996 family)